jgi:tetratricopeptide (TPR) repeat protein
MIDKSAIIKAAQKHLAKGNIDKAIVEWEKLASAYPEGNTFNFIGDLYLKKGDKKTAAETYHKAAAAYREEGFSLKAIAIFKKILNVRPNDSSALISLGELSEEKAVTTDAIKYYLAATDMLSRENKKGELLKVYDRILNLAPKNVNLRIKIAELFSKEAFIREAAKEYYHIGLLFLEQDDTESARAYLMKSMEIQPSDKETLIALSQLSERVGDLEQARDYVRTAIEKTGEDDDLLLLNSQLLIEGGSINEAADCINRVLEADPSNIEARKKLASLYEKNGEREKAWQEYIPVIENLIENENIEEAITLLSAYKDLEPVENGKKLVEFCKQIGNDEHTVKELMDLFKAYNNVGMPKEALQYLKEAFEIQPFNTELKEKIEELEGTSAPGQPAGTTGTGEPAEAWPSVQAELQVEAPEPAEDGVQQKAWPQMDPVTEQFTEGGDKNTEEILTEADVFLKYGLYGDAKNLLEKLKVDEPQNINVHLKLKALYTETNDIEQAVAECIILSTLASRNGDEEKSGAYLKDAYELNPDDPRLKGKVPRAAMNEAPALQETGQDSELAASDYEDYETPDLGVEEIKEPELDSEVANIFDEFKKGLEKEIEAEDVETHYNLGIAYKEMGLVDDAIKEFQTSKVDPKYYVQSMSMLGICYMEKGLYSLAIEAFSGALLKVEKNDSLAWGIKYDLAEAYEKTNRTNEATELYTQVFGWNAKFRSVSEKLNKLKGGTGAKAKPRGKKSRVSYI